MNLQSYCHDFVLPQRLEDTVLATVVRKTDQIRHGLGCLPPVVIRKLNDLLAKGINPTALASTLAEIEGLDQEEAARFARVLEQRRRILSSCSRVKDNPDQLLLELGDIADAEELKAVRRQVSDNWRYWERRLASIDTDLEREPECRPTGGAGRGDRRLAAGLTSGSRPIGLRCTNAMYKS